jgi:tetratricopeptide (TPR) repeat protein
MPLIALAALGPLLWWQRHRLGRGPLVAAAYYVVTLAPALGLVQHGFMAFAWVADRFQYLPSIGPLALLGAWLGRHNVAAYPEGWQGRAQLAGGLAREGNHAEAVDQLAQVLRYDPDERHTIHLELASMQTNLGRYDDARENIEAALRLVPDYAEAHYEYGRWLEKRGQADEAAQRYRRALTLRPGFPQAEAALRTLPGRLPLPGGH